MAGTIVLSCGHTDQVRPFGWPITLKDDDGFGRAVSYSNFCLDCYKKALEEYPEDIFINEWEIDEYLSSPEEENNN